MVKMEFTDRAWDNFKSKCPETHHQLTVRVSGPPTTAKHEPTESIAKTLEGLGYDCILRMESEPLTNEVFASKKKVPYPDGRLG